MHPRKTVFLAHKKARLWGEVVGFDVYTRRSYFSLFLSACISVAGAIFGTASFPSSVQPVYIVLLTIYLYPSPHSFLNLESAQRVYKRAAPKYTSDVLRQTCCTELLARISLARSLLVRN
jgi:hypothetical protein